jgi:hypothetical protein
MDIRPVTLCLLGSDTDCDGTTYFAHRIRVPRFMLGASIDALVSFVNCYAEARIDRWDIHEAITADEFNARFTLDEHDRIYFRRAGYVSLDASWNPPWVCDDSVGIPAYWPAD